MHLPQVKKLLNQVRDIGIVELHRRPWGTMYYLTIGELQIKVIKCYEGERTSLQYHNEKIEVIIPLEGKGNIIVDDNIVICDRPGTPIFITPKTHHQVIGPLLYLEIETNDRDLDTIRVQDDYGRPTL